MLLGPGAKTPPLKLSVAGYLNQVDAYLTQQRLPVSEISYAWVFSMAMCVKPVSLIRSVMAEY